MVVPDLFSEGSEEQPKLPARRLRLVPEGSDVGEVIAALQMVGDQARQEWNREQRLQACAALIFSYWAKRLRHEHARLDRKREVRLLQRLRENDGDVSELLYAIDGAMREDNLMGRRPDSVRKHDGIRTIFRDREQVEQLAEMAPGFRDNKPHPLAVKYGLA